MFLYLTYWHKIKFPIYIDFDILHRYVLREKERGRERERIRKNENNRELVKHKFVFRNKSLSQF